MKTVKIALVCLLASTVSCMVRRDIKDLNAMGGSTEEAIAHEAILGKFYCIKLLVTDWHIVCISITHVM